MPMLVSSTSVPPPRFRNSMASSIAVCSSATNQLSLIGLRARVRSSLSMVSSCSHRYQSVAGVLSSGWYVLVVATNRCSCIRVIPSWSGSMGPRTVITLPTMFGTFAVTVSS